MNNSQPDPAHPQDRGDILIVDDTLLGLQALSAILTEHGYKVRGASDGPTALMIAETAPPDLILLDIRMPQMDGFEVCRRLKAGEKTHHIPVVFISALGELTDKIKGFEAGGIDYIAKPLQIEEVLARVQTHLALRELQKQLEAQNAQLRRVNDELKREIAERVRAEQELRRHRDHLEELVEERTAELRRAFEEAKQLNDELTRVNDALKREIAERVQAEERARKLNEDLERRARELDALNKAGQAMVSVLERDKVLKLVIEETRKLLDTEAAAVLLYDSACDELVFAAASSPGADELVGTRMPVTSGIAGWTVREKQPVLVNNTYSDPRFYGKIDAQTSMKTRSIIAAPLIARGEVIGVIEAVNKLGGLPAAGPGPFTEHDLEMLEAMAGSATIAIENARLYQAEREQFHRLHDSQAQLIHAEKMSALGRLTASIAHEINNPLQAVQTCLSVVKEELDEEYDPGEIQGDLEIAGKEIERISNIVNRLRDFYRPAREEPRLTDLHALLESVLELAHKRLQHAGIAVEHRWVEELPLIQTNPDLLKQVFLNLLINAIEAMPGGGTLGLSTSMEQMQIPNGQASLPAVHIEFGDTGEGIPAATLPRVFEPFFTTKQGGTGLGLSISYEIIKSLEGEITVASQEGEGTTFTILLPVRG